MNYKIKTITKKLEHPHQTVKMICDGKKWFITDITNEPIMRVYKILSNE